MGKNNVYNIFTGNLRSDEPRLPVFPGPSPAYIQFFEEYGLINLGTWKDIDIRYTEDD